ncbi:hypothetical protein [Chryseobacterium indoltheticum]|uniref:Uncharacterized protein n=1 Tax=Chryseobacterium indoltheticum TaxID=254 RepID=A0A381FBW0_9FLAO|nr:hypothetical protein [Chryseobacterium indoltheticum]SUX43953.1 Uncharacterised protein [Chryseobacterium indoltheticum]
MKLNDNKGEFISLDEAILFTSSFQKLNPDQLKSFFGGGNKINAILQQDNCIGIRIYNGYDDNVNQTNLIIIGVDKEGEDITSGLILERLSPCPPDCPTSSPLIKQ